jgi:hypothetical protein
MFDRGFVVTFLQFRSEPNVLGYHSFGNNMTIWLIDETVKRVKYNLVIL